MLPINAKNTRLFPVDGRIDATAAATSPICDGGSEGPEELLDKIGDIGFGVGGRSLCSCGSVTGLSGSVTGSRSNDLDWQQSRSVQF